MALGFRLNLSFFCYRTSSLGTRCFSSAVNTYLSSTMDFSFKTRGGTAPTLTRVYGRPNRTERSAHGKNRRQRNRMEDTDGVSGLSRAPPTLCGQRQRQRLDKGQGKPPKPRAGWQAGHADSSRNSDNMASMSSTHQALSDLMNLNLTQKYGKSRNRGITSRKQQQERRHAFAASATKVKNDRLGTGGDTFRFKDLRTKSVP